MAFAQSGGSGNPYFVREYETFAKGGAVRSCSTTSSLLVDGDMSRRVWVAKRLTSGSVYICCDAFSGPDGPIPNGPTPTPSPTPSACTTAAATIVIDSDTPSYTEADSARVRCTCITSTGTVDVRVTWSK